MAASLASDGSEDVQDFLRRMKELNEQRAQEDLEEQRRLEQQILKDRAARAARREERARSISPVKQASPMPILPFRPPAIAQNADSDIEQALNFANAAIAETRKVSQPRTPVKPHELSLQTTPKSSTADATTATRPTPTLPRTPPVGGLSWKGGVSSGLGSIRSRPRSVVLGRGIRETTPLAEQVVRPREDESPPEIKDAAKLLASKDPSWFKQTRERDTISSKAFRKNLEDDGVLQSHGRSFGLPGLSDSSISQNGRVQAETRRAVETLREESIEQAQAKDDTTYTSQSTKDLKLKSPSTISPKPINLPSTPEPEGIAEKSQSFANSVRSPSPTKGLGGFVQSAMLKRSDSLKKRWSTVTPNSTRSQFMSSQGSSRSPERPTVLDKTLFSSPPPPNNSFSKAANDTDSSPSASPRLTSKLSDKTTFDTSDSPSKRFSPVKSSWLTNAISKPETPPQFSVTPVQPSWMTDLQRSKQEKSENVARPPSPHKEVAIGGLLRSPAMGQTMKPQILNQGSIRSSEMPSFSVTSPKAVSPSPVSTKFVPAPEVGVRPTFGSKKPPDDSSIPEVPRQPLPSSGSSLTSTDTSRDLKTEKQTNEKEPLEFRAAASNLKRAQTQKYQASDPLKTNILAGKASLVAPQSPEKTERIDDFKRDLLQKRHDIKKVEKPAVRKPSSQVSRANLDPAVLSEKVNNSDAKREQHTENIIPASELKPEKKHSAPARLQEPPKPTIGGKFAGKFDPNMMSFLTKGGPPKISKEPESISTKTGSDGQDGALNHVNKGRAKGPKRRLPATAANGSSTTPVSGQRMPVKDFKEDTLLAKTNGLNGRNPVQKDLDIPKRDIDKLSPGTNPKSPLPPTKSQSVRSFSKEIPQSTNPAQDSRLLHPIAKFFESPRFDLPQTFNIQDYLPSKITTPEKIKSLRKEIVELKSGGRKEHLPSSQEHVLFSESIYLCTHVYGSADGRRRTKSYLWIGEDVASPVFEADAQNMARVAAKEANSELDSMIQGKESASFIEALGGILVVRKGRSDKAKAEHVLCGRSYLGHIVFDEITVGQFSLCSGFPYIVSLANGSTVLWKGKGASTNEVGCARLIAMDLSATGEIEEIDEGSEATSFCSRIGVSAPRTNTNIWTTKSRIDDHETRLFAFRQETKILTPLIKEIFPFSQKDLRDEGIYMLDCGVAVHVLAGPKSSSQAVALGHAVAFAQAFSEAKTIPAFVSVGQVPLQAQLAFRSWQSQYWSLQQPALLELPLQQVLEMIRSG